MSKLIEKAKILAESGRVDAATDLIFRTIDNLMRDEELDEIDSIIENIDCDELGEDLLLGVLTATLPVKSQLKNRNQFVKSIEEFFLEKYGPEKSTELLSGLK